MAKMSLLVRHPAGRLRFKKGVRLESAPLIGNVESDSATTRWNAIPSTSIHPSAVKFAWVTRHEVGDNEEGGFVYAMKDAGDDEYYFMFFDCSPD